MRAGRDRPLRDLRQDRLPVRHRDSRTLQDLRELRRSRDDLAGLVAEEPGHIAELVRIDLACLSCGVQQEERASRG
ncbi:MAG: hypothetical protein ACK55I_14345, partial [bacterium]